MDRLPYNSNNTYLNVRTNVLNLNVNNMYAQRGNFRRNYREFNQNSAGGRTKIFNNNNNDEFERRMRDLGIVLSRPKFPSYSVIVHRIMSFENWPDPSTQHMISMFAEAGLFYTKVDDITQCFYCGFRFNDWTAGDSVWKTHALGSSNCDFVLLSKGAAFIKDVSRMLPDNGPKCYQHHCETDKVMSSSPIGCQNVVTMDEKCPSWRGDEHVKRALDMGFDVKLIASAIVANNCTMFDILEELLDGIENLDTRINVEVEEQTPNDSAFSALSISKRMPPDRLCKICMNDESTVVLLPCSHLISCPSCSPALEQCPVCRSEAIARIRIYSA